MPAPKFIDIGGKHFLLRELLQRRREQLATAKVEQPILFEMKLVEFGLTGAREINIPSIRC